MGKKHKKHHRSERRETDDGTPEKAERASMEPPLRLVLKVGKGSETIMTASPSSDHFSTAAESPSTPDPDYAKHSHHKKKKKKKKSDHDRKRSSAHFEGSPAMTPDPDTQEEEDEEMEGSEEGTEGGWGDPPSSKKFLMAMHDRRAYPTRHCKDEAPPPPEKKPLLKVLENLHKTLQRKDADSFFAWPVSDIIAPGYSSIILYPMDFSTMRKKIDREEYVSIDEYKADFTQMCENAMKYNRPETIYYKAAKKLLTTGQRVMSKERLATIKRAFSYVEDGDEKPKPRGKPKKLLVDKENTPLGDGPDYMELSNVDPMDSMMADDSSYIADTDITGKSDDEDDMDEDDAKVLIQEVLEAAKAAKDRLTARQPNSKIGFLRKDKAGTTTLAILNPDRDESDRRVNLSMLTSRLTHGTSSLPGFKEDKRNKALPVSYLVYGPFCSFGPEYDSTFANLSKEESDLVYNTYGDEEGVKYAQSIQEYVKDSGDHVSKMVDTLLDSLTNGEHSRTKEQIRQNHEVREKQKELGLTGPDQVSDSNSAQGPAQDVKIDYDGLKSLADEGIDMSFLPELEKEMSTRDRLQSEMQQEVDQKLGKAAALIHDLEKSQNERLSRKPPPHLQYVSGPSEQEYAIAEKLTQQLKELAAKSLPGSIAPTEAVRKAMGVTLEPLPDPPSLPSVATSQTGPSETTEGSSMVPDDSSSVLPDDIAKELEGVDDEGTGGDGLDGKGVDEDDDADVGDELLEFLGDKGVPMVTA